MVRFFFTRSRNIRFSALLLYGVLSLYKVSHWYAVKGHLYAVYGCKIRSHGDWLSMVNLCSYCSGAFNEINSSCGHLKIH